jgi:prefoldin subunit 5
MAQSSEQQKLHLDSAVEQQQVLLNEIQELQSQVNQKREIILKVQGVIEYLQQVVETSEPVVVPEKTEGEPE